MSSWITAVEVALKKQRNRACEFCLAEAAVAATWLAHITAVLNLTNNDPTSRNSAVAEVAGQMNDTVACKLNVSAKE